MNVDERPLIKSEFFPPSCAHAVVSVMQKGEYRIVLPDPGEYARALCGNDEMMFSVPRDKIDGLVVGLRNAQERDAPFVNENMMMRPDFPQPELYKNVFRAWGMDTEE
jgi:hypothetical protein